jgi:parallel beta-helix repeat protein
MKRLLPLAALALALAAARAADPVSAAPFLDRAAPDCGLQKALDSLKDKGGVLLLPEGEFPIHRYLFLPSGVALRGAGQDKTVLAFGSPPSVFPIVESDPATNSVTVEGDPSGLRPGNLVIAMPHGRSTHPVHRRYGTVVAVEGKRVRLEGLECKFNPVTKPWLVAGRFTRVAEEGAKGASALKVTDPSVCRPGWALTLSGKGDDWDHHYNVIASVQGNTLQLERPLTVTATTNTLVWLNHAMITAEKQDNLGVEDLTIRGCATPETVAPWGGFLIAGIHFTKCGNPAIRRVTIENWNGDGFSVQGGTNAVVERCVARNNLGHGFHPGTGLQVGRFSDLQSLTNGGDGLYYCWHNFKVDTLRCVLKANRGSGIGGLGNPGDHECTVADNTIEDNDLAGIHAYGGWNTANVIRNNTIRNNSRAKAGKWPGVAIYAIYQEPSFNTTVCSNVIESTLPEPTQLVGIEEQPAAADPRFAKTMNPVYGLFLSDSNRFFANQVKGHATADLVVAGPNTLVGDGQGKVEKRLPKPKDTESAKVAPSKPAAP